MRLKIESLIWVCSTFLVVSCVANANGTNPFKGFHPEGRHGPPDMLQMPVTVKTQSAYGRIFTIYGKDGSDIVFTLAVKVEDGFVAFDLLDEKNENIASGRGEKVDDNLKHDFTIKIDSRDKLVGLDGKITTLIHARNKILDTDIDVDVEIIIGQIEGDEDSILGCISLITLNLGNDIDFLEATGENSYSRCEIEPKEPVAPIGDGIGGEFKPDSPPNIVQPLQPDQEKEKEKGDEQDEQEIILERDDDDVEQPAEATNEKDEPVIELEPKVPLPENNTIPLKAQEEGGLKIGGGVISGGKKTEPNQETNCHPHERAMCQNSITCIRRPNESDPTCVCKEGFAGKFCQFSTFPRSCYDAMKFYGEQEPGAYVLDFDGSGPMEPTFAECDKDGATIVAHNMPNDTEVRSQTHNSSRYFPITYKLFSGKQLQALMRKSESCEQYIRYDCDGAPIKFAENKTFFVTVDNKQVRQMGNMPMSCSCREGGYGCIERKACNCETSKVGQYSDEGILRNENAGISFIYSRKYKKMGSARMTLGSLICYGEAGHLPDQAITLKSKGTSIQIHENFAWTRFEFEFRTNQAEISNFLTATANGYSLNVGLTTGHRVLLTINSDKDQASSVLTLSLMSQAKLSDLKWHRITVEVLRGEVRLSIDKLNTFEKFERNFPETKFLFGSTENEPASGFVGCLRNFIVNENLLKLNEYLPNDNSIAENGCKNLCASHLCEQESRCIEHFDTGTTSCECKNKFIHSGVHCEENINKDTEISFHNRNSGFLKYTNQDLPANPLISHIIFSARTDQKQALFVYAHDEYDNFVQVHLADEYRIVLTLNNKTDVVTCTVYSEGGKEFSDMRWLQIVVERSDERTTLTVNDEQCEISGRILLADTNIEDMFNVSTITKDTILPPKAAGPVSVTQSYQILFIGGVPRASTALGSYRRTKRQRTAYYITDIPPILGCMRGFMIGTNLLDLRDSVAKRLDKNDVRIGCSNNCDSISCENGGHCTVQWHNYDPSKHELTECDCSKTSYYGQNCLSDAGVMFTGTSAIFFNMSEPRKYMLHESDEQTFQFAFAPTLGNHQMQRLATIYFDDNSQFQINLNRNDSINVGIINSNGTAKVWTFSGNFSDGYRHFFQSTFTQQEPILILVDSEKKYLDNDIRLQLSDARSFYFGGLPIHVVDKPTPVKIIDQEVTINHSVIKRYKGCMSNIDIDFHRNEAVHFRPLLDYANPDGQYSNSVLNEPPTAENLNKGDCPIFRFPGALPSQQRNVQFPLWEAPFSSIDYVDNAADKEPSDEKSYWWLWLIIILLILLLLAILLVLCILKPWKKHDNSNNRRPDIPHHVGPKYPEQHIPLNPGLQAPPIGNGTGIRDDYTLPPPNRPLYSDTTTGRIEGHPTDPPPNYESPRKNTGSLVSTSTIYYSAKDYFEDDDEFDPIDKESQYGEGYGEEKPDIVDENKTRDMSGVTVKPMTSFGKADRTAPPHSPLNRSPLFDGEPRFLKPIITPKPKNLLPSPDQSPL